MTFVNSMNGLSFVWLPGLLCTISLFSLDFFVYKNYFFWKLVKSVAYTAKYMYTYRKAASFTNYKQTLIDLHEISRIYFIIYSVQHVSWLTNSVSFTELPCDHGVWIWVLAKFELHQVHLNLTAFDIHAMFHHLPWQSLLIWNHSIPWNKFKPGIFGDQIIIKFINEVFL